MPMSSPANLRDPYEGFQVQLKLSSASPKIVTKALGLVDTCLEPFHLCRISLLCVELPLVVPIPIFVIIRLH